MGTKGDEKPCFWCEEKKYTETTGEWAGGDVCWVCKGTGKDTEFHQITDETGWIDHGNKAKTKA